MMTIEELHKLFLNCSTASTDSRNDCTGSMFFALSGPNFNGNTFAKVAIEKGAKYAIIDDVNYKTSSAYILVDNCLKTLQKLAAFHREYWGKKILALTGSNGKTTTKELCHAVLSQKYNVLSTIGNLNNHIGVPLTLLRLNESYDLAIIEMGANHQYEIEDLCKITKPNYGLITNIGLAHLEGFGSQEIIAKSKRELFDAVEKNNGQSFVNFKDPFLNTGNEPNATFFNTDFEIKQGFHACMVKDGHTIQSKLVGSINAINMDAAYTIGQFFEVPTSKIKAAIENYTPSNNRSENKKGERNDVILDAYNANPSSVAAALKDFNETDKPNKLVILGTMAELGKQSESEHKKIVTLIKELNLNAIYIGDGFKALVTEEKHYNSATSDDLMAFCKKLNKHTILIKGSRSQALEKLFPLL